MLFCLLGTSSCKRWADGFFSTSGGFSKGVNDVMGAMVVFFQSCENV